MGAAQLLVAQHLWRKLHSAGTLSQLGAVLWSYSPETQYICWIHANKAGTADEGLWALSLESLIWKLQHMHFLSFVFSIATNWNGTVWTLNKAVLSYPHLWHSWPALSPCPTGLSPEWMEPCCVLQRWFSRLGVPQCRAVKKHSEAMNWSFTPWGIAVECAWPAEGLCNMHPASLGGEESSTGEQMWGCAS